MWASCDVEKLQLVLFHWFFIYSIAKYKLIIIFALEHCQSKMFEHVLARWSNTIVLVRWFVCLFIIWYFNIIMFMPHVAMGCVDIEVPPGVWAQRTDNTAFLGCTRSAETWHMYCKDLAWIGEMKNCTPGKHACDKSIGLVDFKYGLANQFFSVARGFQRLGLLLGLTMSNTMSNTACFQTTTSKQSFE